jgi:hypothetical protein
MIGEGGLGAEAPSTRHITDHVSMFLWAPTSVKHLIVLYPVS